MMERNLVLHSSDVRLTLHMAQVLLGLDHVVHGRYRVHGTSM